MRRVIRNRFFAWLIPCLYFALPLSVPILLRAQSEAHPGKASAAAARAPQASPAKSDPAPDAEGAAAAHFGAVYGLVEQNYMDPTDPGHLIFDGAIRGMLSVLDPFSAFFDPQQFQMLQAQTRGEALGFGSILDVSPGKVLVLETAQGSPTWRAGLGPGDQIVEINGQRVESLDFMSLIHLLQSSRSKPVHLAVIHPGHDVPRDYFLKPAQVAMPTVDRDFKFESRDIGYIHISGFEAKTAAETLDAINKLGGNKLHGLLLDLRNNHGGVVATSVAVASLFLKPGQTVFSVRGRSMKAPKSYDALKAPTHFDFPIVVLVNGETASAAELLAGALQDHDRAVIAGEPTFGKGLVQEVVPLSDQTGMALVTALYFTPSGRSVQRPLPGTALARAVNAVDAKGGFHSDDGRPLESGGGVRPDVLILPRQLDPWEVFLERGPYFTDFASNYLLIHPHAARSFEPDAAVLANFKDYLHEKGIRTPDEYWTNDQDFLKLQIKIEVLNLAFGLPAGNEAETRDDPQVVKALTLFPRVTKLLKGPATPGAAAKSR